MDPGYITPFITSLKNVFQTMLQLPVTVGQPVLKKTSASTYDVSGIIGLSGDVVGSVVLSFPRETAEKVVALFSGEQWTADHPDFADAVGELANMVSGGAKGMFSDDKGKSVSISTPSVVVGKDHMVRTQKETPCVVLPCACDCGEMSVEISIKEAGAADAQPKKAAA